MTEKIEGKNGNQWQFISDENDIEIINKKLDWIANRIYQDAFLSPEQIIEYKKLFGNKDESKE